ncbi:condensation domain-containing protein, partial [Halostreptopolyspora alba]
MIPLSFAQRRMWLLHQLERESEAYNISAAFRLTGALDQAALVAAIRDVVDRHEILRTTYVTDDDGEPYQRILPVAQASPQVSVVEVAPEDVSSAVDEAIAYRFDLAAEIPVRASLLRCSPRQHVLVLVIHHIAMDGSSGAPLARDLAEAYTARRDGRAPEWEPLPVQYKDYTLWQREVLGDLADPGSLGARQVEYWRAELAEVPQPLSLPLDHPRPAEASPQGDTVDLVVEPELAAGLQKLAAERRTTMSMVLQTALAVLLHKLSGEEDITIGSPIAGRTDEALTDLIGFFVNTLVLRVDLSGSPSFADLLAQVRDRALAAYEHQDVPFEVLVETINPDRSAAYQPLFQVMFAWQNYVGQNLELPGLEVEFEQTNPLTAKFDLCFGMAMDDSGTLRGDIQYATQLFDRDTVEAIASRFTRVMEQLVADPGMCVGDVDVLGVGEREWLVWGVNETACP